MTYKIGDRVIHRAYGSGMITQLEEKQLAGQKKLYYVVQIKDMTIWVPFDEGNQSSLRFPMSENDFSESVQILCSPGESLSDDRMERKTQLIDKLQDGTLKSVCQAIRDINLFGIHNKLNESDISLLNRARRSLLEEWSLALSIPPVEAQKKLDQLLENNRQTTSEK
jgi:CarD family transcriptional regulator